MTVEELPSVQRIKARRPRNGKRLPEFLAMNGTEDMNTDKE